MGGASSGNAAGAGTGAGAGSAMGGTGGAVGRATGGVLVETSCANRSSCWSPTLMVFICSRSVGSWMTALMPSSQRCRREAK